MTRLPELASSVTSALAGRFAAQVTRTPNAVAVVDGDRELRYDELAAAAARVGRRLEAAGVPAGTLVGLRMPRGADLVAAILGILGHGCAYVPVDPVYPLPRQRYIVTDAGLDAMVEADPVTGEPTVVNAAAGPPQPVPPDAAYVIYTSGSTGAPKGVVVGNGHVLALLDACDMRFRCSGDDVWTMFHSPSFDFSVWELWGALGHGGRLVVVPSSVAADSRAFADLLADEAVTVLSQVPTAFGHLVAELERRPVRLPALRYVVFGGEALNLAAVRTWRGLRLAPGAELVNMYGITETTVHVTHEPLVGEDEGGEDEGGEDAGGEDAGGEDAGGNGGGPPGSTPIGYPLPHLQVHLVDESGSLVGTGTPGEMLVAGASVTYGYLGRPELTAQRFVEYRGERVYRSGDWAVRDDQGRLHYLGRQDRQVQLRGFRVELGEPEAVIAGHPLVAQCAVAAEPNQLDELQLVAYYATRAGADLEPDEVRAFVAGRLPAHLVPSRIRRVAALPRTAHGKVDLMALRSATQRTASSDFAFPSLGHGASVVDG